MKNYRIIKGKKVSLKQLAAYSRQFTVKNNTIGTKEKTVILGEGKDKFEVDVIEQYGKMYHIPAHNSFNKLLGIAGKVYTVSEKPDELGLHFSLVSGASWDNKKHPQPKRLIKCKARKYSNWKSYAPQDESIKKIKREKRNDFAKYSYDLPKMNKFQYMEKLVEHKTAKWERKNPCPAEMFTDDVEKWKQERENAKQRFRDFVVSIYDPLWIMGNRVDTENAKMKASKIAEVKDVDGKGHDVNYPNLSTGDKLYKDANKKAREVMEKDASIIDADLMNHKRNQKRPLEPKRAKTVTLADKKFKKAA